MACACYPCCLACLPAHTDPPPHSTQRWVFLFSDANFRRYSIDPERLGGLMSSGGPRVRARVIFISPGLQARGVAAANPAAAAAGAMPPGMAHVVLAPGDLPHILRGMLATQAFAGR